MKLRCKCKNSQLDKYIWSNGVGQKYNVEFCNKCEKYKKFKRRAK